MRLAFAATVRNLPLHLLPGIFGILLCSSCATTTRYSAVQPGETFSEFRVAPDQFRVTFQGKAETDLGRAYDLALLHSAEMARQNGFPFFAVLDATNASSLKTYTTHRQVFAENGVLNPTTGPHYAPGPYYDGLQPHVGGFVTVEEPATYFKPGATFLIKCFAEKPPKPFTFDAADLERSLKAKYGIHP